MKISNVLTKYNSQILILILLCTHQVTAKSGNETSGIGIILGKPTGLSLKLFDTGHTHFNAAFSWSLRKDTNLYLHADYIFMELNNIQFSPKFSMTSTMGLGGRLKTKDAELGLRIPFGLSYNFKENPFDFFIELVPTMDLIPETHFEVGAALALRYLF